MLKNHAFRLLPGQDLKASLEQYVRDRQIKAGVILSGVGSLQRATLRLADESLKTFEQKFEIVSLTGTLSQDGCHLHISLADSQGQVVGGHLKGGCLIYTTAEMVIGEISDVTFKRRPDQDTGFNELVVES